MVDRIVIVSGSPGAGKSTVIHELANLSGYKIANMGTLMLEHAIKKGYAKDRDSIRCLSPSQIAELRHLSIRDIHYMHGKVIIDTHTSIGEKGRYIPGLPLEALEDLHNVSALIYIDAPAKDIIERRMADKTRTREEDDAHMVDAQRLINISMLSFSAAHLNKPIYMVINRQGKLKECIDEIKQRFEEIFG